MEIFKSTESEVRVYSRAFPVIFNRAKNAHLYAEDGKAYLDFLAGAGSLNYGHNNDILKKALLEYIENDGVSQGLDMYTTAKHDFMEAYKKYILEPRDLDYKMQFTGPTGTNCVEAAMKLARKVKGRDSIISFTNGFHGVSLGAVAATGNKHHRGGAGVALGSVSFMPYDGYLGDDVDTIEMMDKMLTDNSSGIDLPAAVIVEAVQGEGGLNAARAEWLQKLSKLCKKHDILLIVDDIQAGNGRTGQFFSFEEAGIKPDIVTVSKSLSGYGLPMALVLFKRELDVWTSGEHNGTFRGNNMAFATARAALETYWKDNSFADEVKKKAGILNAGLKAVSDQFKGQFKLKGRGMMQGIACRDGDLAGKICARAFEKGLIIETAGPDDEVVKCLMPLTISDEDLQQGLDLLKQSVEEIMKEDMSQAS
ncbi:MAG: diaminobutyrate--2-oxoglutarate transaminase [Alteromonadaceae bacterium]|uniref:diaminobutyrate--2-oxoglutarate transaminase n=1 Tax=unclassified Marinobacter TaxID=83889 RepID=UPI000C5A4CE6|nr:diaminobutyrate--2-oxoglutarate transaminase [Marinobacter sp. BGYM27]MAA65415.1 diaminobutyrate--2-oxoglutarate transaminase [Alteromonadaceae bacterium]MBH85081.1 diaminobutyrate--2-oxoglutarate transaminase [Alteromonadaceae bacterium]MDG5500126.1 diaminobutyrate--2-oxoglutarate transaminase [Marinobacter sp. BGYM27]|tara:strand:+ start:22418 stop:23686 length:1269 start_codon:yes stop_codon:yes gene_type:complete